MEQLNIFDIIEPKIDTRGFTEKFIRLRDYKIFELKLFSKDSNDKFCLCGKTIKGDHEGFSTSGEYSDLMYDINMNYTHLDDFKNFNKMNKELIKQHQEVCVDKFGFQPLNFYRKPFEHNRVLFLQKDIETILNAKLECESDEYKLYVGSNNVCKTWFLIYKCSPHYDILIQYNAIYDNKWLGSAEVYYGHSGSLIEQANQNKEVYQMKWYAHLFKDNMSLDELKKIIK